MTMTDVEEKSPSSELPAAGTGADISIPVEDKEASLDRPRSARSVTTSSASSETSDTRSEGPAGGVEAGRPQPIDPEPYPPPVIVPRTKRRGVLARFTILAEVENAVHYERRKKWIITFIVALCGAVAPFASAIFLPALTPITNEFKTTPFTANLSVALYMLAMGIFPLWWSSFSEQFGRRSIYIISYVLFVIFSVLAAVSSTIGMFITMRLLNGGASASVQAVGAGTIADIWEPRERGRAMGLFYLGPLCGPLLGPIVGGGLTQGFGWRSTMWFMAVLGGLILICIVFALPETKQPNARPSDIAEIEAEGAAATTVDRGAPLTRTSTRQSVTAKSKKYIKWFRILFVDPLAVLKYLQYPAVALTVYYSSVTFGALYTLNISLEYTFSRPPYRFSSWLIGFVYFPGSFGYLVTSILSGGWMDRIMRREAIKAQRYDAEGRLVYIPEDRMRENAYLGAIMWPLALIWYGWAAEKHAMWVGVLLSPFFFGVGTMIIFAMATTMLTEFLPRNKSSSGVAINNLMRNIFSCGGALIATPIIEAIGNGWLMTILGAWGLSSAAVFWGMRRFGPEWRKKMERGMS